MQAKKGHGGQRVIEATEGHERRRGPWRPEGAMKAIGAMKDRDGHEGLEGP